MNPPWAFLTGVMSSAVILVVGWWGARANRKVAAIESATPAYSDMDQRVRYVETRYERLEARVEQLERDRDVDRGHIIDVHRWDRSGREPYEIPAPPLWHRELFPTKGKES